MPQCFERICGRTRKLWNIDKVSCDPADRSATFDGLDDPIGAKDEKPRMGFRGGCGHAYQVNAFLPEKRASLRILYGAAVFLDVFQMENSHFPCMSFSSFRTCGAKESGVRKCAPCFQGARTG